MHFRSVRLHAPEQAVPGLTEFYGGRVGTTELDFVPSTGEPFYHLALLVPGDRFDAAFAWAHSHVELVGGVFEFDAWDARACYFLDAAGSIVELIAHAGVGESGAVGAFQWAELLGVSELGLVGDPLELVTDLATIGLELWDGGVGPGRLAFVGERARTLIVVPPGRGWLPTGRPAEAHPADVVVGGIASGTVAVGPYRVSGEG